VKVRADLSAGTYSIAGLEGGAVEGALKDGRM